MQSINIDKIRALMGEAFGNRFNLIASLGKGGMGSVYLIESNDRMQLQWALKVIEKGNRDYFTEVEILKTLNHPGIPKVIEVVETDNYFLIVQELIKGKSLLNIINENGHIDENIVALWMSDLADTLSYIHGKGYIHRDIKPSNIMITEEGDVKLIDFGISKSANNIDEIDQNIVGTRNYTAPERYEKNPADKRSDIYGYGSTCYYLATGSVPLEITSSTRGQLKIMESNLENVQNLGIKNIIRKCIDFKPNKRFQDFNEVRYSLKRLDEFEAAKDRSEKKRKQQFTAVIILFLLGIASVFSGFYINSEERTNHYTNLIQSAEENFNNGDFSEARTLYNEAINYNSKQLAGYQGINEISTKVGDYDSVVNSLTELIQNNKSAGEDARILYLLGNAYYELGEYGQAEGYLKQAVELDPSLENNLVLGLNYSAQGNYNEAQNVIADLKNNGFDSNAVNYLSGQISRKQGNTNEAINSFNQVINSTSDSSLKIKALISLSQLYKDQQNYQGVVDLLESARSDTNVANDYFIKEKLAEAYYNLGDELNDSPDYLYKAIDGFRSLVDSGYSQPYIYRNLAIIYQKLDDFSNAYSILDELEKAYPNDAVANVQRAWLELDYQSTKSENNRDYRDFLTEYNQAKAKNTKGYYDNDINRLTQTYQELINKGWL